MHNRRVAWFILLATLVVAFVGFWLTGGSPVEAETPGQDHSSFSNLTGPFETPQDVTAACLKCHVYDAGDVMDTVHWTWETTDPITGQQLGKNNVINNYCVAVPSNEPRCTSCHVGFGYTDDTFFETATEVDVDCLVCHDTTGTYKKFPTGAGYPVFGTEAKEFPAGSGNMWEPVDLVAVAQSVGEPGRANCGSCHFFGGGGDAVKHGDLDSTLANPTRELDVHMGTDGGDFSCATCHARDNHEIAGRIYNGEEPVLCEDCHTGENAPHQDSELVDALGQHVEYIACQTCHIPTFARGQATKMSWDWSTAGEKDENGKPFVVKDDDGHVIYDTQKGTFTSEMNVTPYYNWWNGNTYYVTVADPIDPDQVVTLTTFEGSRGDGKLYPFKQFTGVQPYDAGNNTMVVPHLFPSNANDTAAYWKGWDWNNAVSAGMDYVGADYSGEMGWADTEYFWVQNHMVAPKEDALTCQSCHAEGRLDFEALGYTPARAAQLSAMFSTERSEENGDVPVAHQSIQSYEGTQTCTMCHPDTGREVAESMHYSWLGVAQNVEGSELDLIGMGSEYCGLPASVVGINWLGVLQPQNADKAAQPAGCANCHVGFGPKPNAPDSLTQEDYTNVDCLICHGPDYERSVVKEGDEFKLVPAENVDAVAVSQQAQLPTNDMCLRCHLSTGGGPNYKHGVSPTSPEVDVHLAADLQCIDCHQVDDHRFGGSADLKGVDRPDLLMDCIDCHEPRHSDEAAGVNLHLEKVACQTCHIPAIARDPNYPTMTYRDWTHAELKDTGLYAPQSQFANNITPVYRWWNGQVQSYPPGPVGSIDDPEAKLYPWKYVESIVPADAESGEFMPIKAGVYYLSGDLDAAVTTGAELLGLDYSGSWEPVTDELYFSLNHQVAPAEATLTCADCHTLDGRLDFEALGYSADYAAGLTRLDGRGPSNSPSAQGYRENSDEVLARADAYSQQKTEAVSDLYKGERLIYTVLAIGIVILVVGIVAVVVILRRKALTLKQALVWPRQRSRNIIILVVGIVGVAVIGFLSLHYLFEYTASTQFCGTTCHANRPEYIAYQNSFHARVSCSECHVGPGLDRELQAKANGVRELYLQLTNTYERPIPSPVETLRPAREVCEHCHWPEIFYSDRAVEISHFANDEANTHSNTYMLVKIGGGSERLGQGYGIHWHIENKVEYIATDAQRQNIPWVRAQINGEEVVYVNTNDPLSEEELAQYEIREMDCIDCHNRATHVFRSTDEMLDEALANGVLPVDLPYLRREAWTAMEKHDDYGETMAELAAIPQFYQENYPDVYAEWEPNFDYVVTVLQDMYSSSHFPEMNLDYTTYPDNLAHGDDPGCFRCHDGNHYAEQGEDQSIRLHCTICHTIPQTVIEGEPVPETPFQSAWQPDSHLKSTWIADHRDTYDDTCIACHEEESFCSNPNCHDRGWDYIDLSAVSPSASLAP